MHLFTISSIFLFQSISITARILNTVFQRPLADLAVHFSGKSIRSVSVHHRIGYWINYLVLMRLVRLQVPINFVTACLSLFLYEIGIMLILCSLNAPYIHVYYIKCLPFTYRLKYALNSRETKAIVMQRLIKVDGKVRTDTTYPAGFMDVISIEKTGENFRLIYDTKGRFTVHRITTEEAEYKLAKVKRVQLGKGGIPFLVTHDART